MYRFVLFALLLGVISGCARTVPEDSNGILIDNIQSEDGLGIVDDTSVTTQKEQGFFSDGLLTNTSTSSIDLADVLDGGPGKDGIPSIDTPRFVSQDDASNNYLSDQSQGMLVIVDDIKRWYPYNILNWHEIVNDVFVVDGTEYYLAVTFCPLCGSAIVFDRTIDGEVLEFGVSGKLHNSNLLMYDRSTESLWSQTLGEAVVGDSLGKKLSIVDSHIVSWKDVRVYHPDAMVLSTDTGKRRNYGLLSPYGSYDNNERLYFPVANLDDARLPLKEMLYAANIGDGISIAFVLAGLREQGSATITVDSQLYTAYYEDALYHIVGPDGAEVPGFFEMWFSWANKHPDSSYVWIE